MTILRKLFSSCTLIVVVVIIIIIIFLSVDVNLVSLFLLFTDYKLL